MPTTSAPNGFVPVFHRGGGTIRSQEYPDAITSGLGSNLFKGAPVYFDANGVLALCTATTIVGGIFAGCEYTDNAGKRHVSKHWPTGQVATDIKAWLYSDPDIVFEVQATGAIAQSAVNDQANLASATAGSTTTGFSAAMLSTTLVGATGSDQFQIIDRAKRSDNAWSDTYTRVLVVINEHQFRASRQPAV